MPPGLTPLALNANEQAIFNRLQSQMSNQDDYASDPRFQRDLSALVSAPGKTIAGLARLLGVTRQYLHQLSVRAGIEAGKLREQRRINRSLEVELKQEDVRHAREQRVRMFSRLWQQGLSTAAIANRTRMATRSVAVLISIFRRDHPELFPLRNEGLSRTMAQSWNRRTRRTARVPAQKA